MIRSLGCGHIEDVSNLDRRTGKHSSEVGLEALVRVPGLSLSRQLGETDPDLIDPGGRHHHRSQIGFGEIPIIGRAFLDPHRVGDASFLIPMAGLLSQLAPGLDDRDLPLDLVIDSLFQRAERVHVLDLDFGAEPFGTLWSDRYVGVEANRAFFEPRIRGTQLGDHRPQILGIRTGFGGAADIWPGNHLDEWDTGAVEVEQSRFRGVNSPAIADVSRFAGVLLHVSTLDADPSGLTVDRDV